MFPKPQTHTSRRFRGTASIFWRTRAAGWPSTCPRWPRLAQKNGTLLELSNANPDLTEAEIELAAAKGAKFVLASDAHQASEVGNVDEVLKKGAKRGAGKKTRSSTSPRKQRLDNQRGRKPCGLPSSPGYPAQGALRRSRHLRTWGILRRQYSSGAHPSVCAALPCPAGRRAEQRRGSGGYAHGRHVRYHLFRD